MRYSRFVVIRYSSTDPSHCSRFVQINTNVPIHSDSRSLTRWKTATLMKSAQMTNYKYESVQIFCPRYSQATYESLIANSRVV